MSASSLDNPSPTWERLCRQVARFMVAAICLIGLSSVGMEVYAAASDDAEACCCSKAKKEAFKTPQVFGPEHARHGCCGSSINCGCMLLPMPEGVPQAALTLGSASYVVSAALPSRIQSFWMHALQPRAPGARSVAPTNFPPYWASVPLFIAHDSLLI